MFINNSIFLPIVDPKRHKVTYFVKLILEDLTLFKMFYF